MPDLPLPPGSTLGIIGGGQLGRMLSQAASRLGFDVVILDPEADSPAGRVSARQIVAAYDDPKALSALGRAADVVTFEFENVPAESIERLAEAGAVNAGILAAQILALSDEGLAGRLAAFRAAQTESVAETVED